MISEKDKEIFGFLRKNARINLTDVAKATGIPVSTVYDRVRANEKLFVKKHTTLLDFAKLGYLAKAKIALKVIPKDRERLEKYLTSHKHVNSLYRINYGFDYMAEVIFQSIVQVEDFVAEIENIFEVKSKQIYNVIEEIKREEFVI